MDAHLALPQSTPKQVSRQTKTLTHYLVHETLTETVETTRFDHFDSNVIDNALTVRTTNQWDEDNAIVPEDCNMSWNPRATINPSALAINPFSFPSGPSSEASSINPATESPHMSHNPSSSLANAHLGNVGRLHGPPSHMQQMQQFIHNSRPTIAATTYQQVNSQQLQAAVAQQHRTSQDPYQDHGQQNTVNLHAQPEHNYQAAVNLQPPRDQRTISNQPAVSGNGQQNQEGIQVYQHALSRLAEQNQQELARRGVSTIHDGRKNDPQQQAWARVPPDVRQRAVALTSEGKHVQICHPDGSPSLHLVGRKSHADTSLAQPDQSVSDTKSGPTRTDYYSMGHPSNGPTLPNRTTANFSLGGWPQYDMSHDQSDINAGGAPQQQSCASSMNDAGAKIGSGVLPKPQILFLDSQRVRDGDYDPRVVIHLHGQALLINEICVIVALQNYLNLDADTISEIIRYYRQDFTPLDLNYFTTWFCDFNYQYRIQKHVLVSYECYYRPQVKFLYAKWMSAAKDIITRSYDAGVADQYGVIAGGGLQGRRPSDEAGERWPIPIEENGPNKQHEEEQPTAEVNTSSPNNPDPKDSLGDTLAPLSETDDFGHHDTGHSSCTLKSRDQRSIANNPYTVDNADADTAVDADGEWDFTGDFVQSYAGRSRMWDVDQPTSPLADLQHRRTEALGNRETGNLHGDDDRAIKRRRQE